MLWLGIPNEKLLAIALHSGFLGAITLTIGWGIAVSLTWETRYGSSSPSLAASHQRLDAVPEDSNELLILPSILIFLCTFLG
jgi:hypothetical protein